MCKAIFTLITSALLIMFNQIYAQDTAVYWIPFKYKNTETHTISNPSTYLSPKAISRRLKYSIPIDSTDLPVSALFVAQIKATGAEVMRTSKWLNGAVVYTTDSLQLVNIKSLPYVAFETKIQPRKIKRNTTRDSTKFVQTINEKQMYKYGQAQNQVQQLKLDCLHNLGYTGKGMTISILDGGFRNVDMLSAFDSLRAHNQIKGVYDFVDMDNVVYDWSSDHGTMVLSCLAANLPNQLIGTAPDADYWLLRTEQGGSEYIIEEYNWACGAEFADSVGTDLINSSLGYTTYDDALTSHSYLDMNGTTCPSSKAAALAARKGILVVNSMGNSGNNSWQFLGAPADADSILSIGAVDENGIATGFSSYGPTSDNQPKPNTCARGLRAAIIQPGSGQVGTADGTSFSSPILCGAAACLWQSLPNKNNIEILKIIEQNSHKYEMPDNKLGYGIADFCNSYYQQQPYGIVAANNNGIPTILPNPFNNSFSVIFEAQSTAPINIKIYDANAKLIQQNTETYTAGYIYKISFDELQKTPAGFYFVDVTTDTNRYTLKAIKQ